MEKIGIIPAAGTASRINPIPCSKEIYPVGFRYLDIGEIRPKVACHYLLDRMGTADVEKVYIILRTGKWDIPSYLGTGKTIGVNLAYLVIDQTSGAPFSVDHAFPFVENALILFGFPDIIFGPEDAFIRLIDRQKDSKADIVLGLFKAKQPSKMDMVELDTLGKIREIVIKPASTALKYTWVIAVWTSVFTRFMHIFLSKTFIKEKRELYMGDIIRAGLQNGLAVETVVFPAGNYIDIGTPEDLFTAVKENIKISL